jgi:Holliday junction DNA helicase RuvB
MIESAINDIGEVISTSAPSIVQFENKLRPKSFAEYIGQPNVKRNLGISIAATKKRGDVLDHVLLHGAPGLGKTTLANVIVNEMGVGMKITSGPAIEKPGDVASIISNLEEGDVLFIDEIHRLRPVVEEVLYTAMEDFGIDIIIGKGPSARSMRINLPKFTLIGATTKLSMLSSPLRSRFGNLFKLEFYNDEDVRAIIQRSAGILGVNVEAGAAERLAASSRQTPRIANRLLKRVRDYSEVEGYKVVDSVVVEKALSAIGIDHIGLDHVDRNIITTIVEKFAGGPVGLNTLSAAISEEQSTLEDIYEPFLIKMGFLERTSRGRIVTENAYKHLGLKM